MMVKHLTLTRVVFEYNAVAKPKETLINLTLTRVVFEFKARCAISVAVYI